jgi:hypothetical protein
MPGQRKSLGSLIAAQPPAAATPSTRPDRSARPDGPARNAVADKAAPDKAAADMTTRSWYMPEASADRLAALVDDVHFATRLPKNLIMGAVVNVIDRHRAEVEAEARSVAGQ